MDQTFDILINELRRKNIRLSHRRLKVLEFLYQNRQHPTVDQIFVGIQKEVPNLSKTTVYNILHTLVGAGVVRIINIEDNETRYDIKTGDHGHFKCEKCGAIFDFNIDTDALATDKLAGFKVTDRSVYFKGVCQKCLVNINNND
ncbi:Fur family transcriptional regulator, peroxide stress response regulator [Sporobacter termitidis DSM 10068]|uniref:Fur family transcriptional regulator, peroxide stress response regulator n=1 Tax=Sporobacter termitidis DSM 10068 TaxID=1123282 RepID=A0A1M5YXV5_9FIRM|nr:Fur family transcriptional regulator [Sporobacter termitidis]SHI16363.1 Fur family transcriptional regulator, peroxide stress response regulator [Sporobacter termitidis DSM 10068]